MGSTIDSATTRDGLTLRTRHWPPRGEPWASLLLVHGLSEHSGRYERLGGWLAASGIDVHAYDQRSWGGSGGGRGDVTRWDDFLDDLRERLAATRAMTPDGRPVVVYGHSMGGLIATGYVVSGRPLPDLLVLSAPGVESNHGRALRTLAAVLARVAPTLRPPIVHQGSLLSRDPAVGAAFRVDPLAVHDPTARLGATGFAAQRATRDRLDRMRADGEPFPVPALVLHGADDRIVPAASSERYVAFPGITRRVYPGLRHELHNEPEGEAIIGDVVAWIRAQAGHARAAGPRDVSPPHAVPPTPAG